MSSPFFEILFCFFSFFLGGVLFFIVAIVLSVCTVKICNKRRRRKHDRGEFQKKRNLNPFTFMIEMGANILKLGFKISQISQILYVGVILNANGFLCTNYLGFIIPKYEECIFFFIFAYYITFRAL